MRSCLKIGGRAGLSMQGLDVHQADHQERWLVYSW